MNIFNRYVDSYLDSGWEIIEKTNDTAHAVYPSINVYLKWEKEYTIERPECTWIVEKMPLETNHWLYFQVKKELICIQAKVSEEHISFSCHCVDENLILHSGAEHSKNKEMKEGIKNAFAWFKEKIINLPSYRLPYVTGILPVYYSIGLQDWLS